MTSILIRNGRIILKNAILNSGSVLIGDEKIEQVGKFPRPSGANVIDAKGLFVTPGFIDTHIHGDPAAVFQNEIQYGTTAIVSAISCASSAKLTKSINSIKLYKRRNFLGNSLLGLRLEGPYISKTRAGAQDKKYIRPASISGLKQIISKCDGLLKMMTIAPEIKAAERLIKILRDKGIIASVGHTDADYRTCLKAIKAGATHATHLFNGMRRISDGAVAALACIKDKRMQTEVIFDMIHVKPELLRFAISGKDKNNIILITDSVKAERGIGKPSRGVYRLKDGTIAGSGLTMIRAVKNAVRHCGVRLIDAVNFATLNPARMLKVDNHKGAIAKGQDADIVIFDKDFDVKMTIVRGNIMYRKRGF